MVYTHEGKTAGIAEDLRRMLDEDCHMRLVMRCIRAQSSKQGSKKRLPLKSSRNNLP